MNAHIPLKSHSNHLALACALILTSLLVLTLMHVLSSTPAIQALGQGTGTARYGQSDPGPVVQPVRTPAARADSLIPITAELETPTPPAPSAQPSPQPVQTPPAQ